MTDLALYADENLSNFEGDLDIYTGEDDDFVNFAGARDFINEHKSERVFVMSIDSNVDGVQRVVLVPSYASKLKGASIASNGVIFKNAKNEEIKGVGSPQTIQLLHEFLKAVPSNLVAMRISSTNSDQLQQILSVEEHSPFKKAESKEMFLGTYISENSYRDNMISFPTPNVVLGPETEISLPILKGKTTITFIVGGVLSTSSALRHKTNKAIKQVAYFKRR